MRIVRIVNGRRPAPQAARRRPDLTRRPSADGVKPGQTRWFRQVGREWRGGLAIGIGTRAAPRSRPVNARPQTCDGRACPFADARFGRSRSERRRPGLIAARSPNASLGANGALIRRADLRHSPRLAPAANGGSEGPRSSARKGSCRSASGQHLTRSRRAGSGRSLRLAATSAMSRKLLSHSPAERYQVDTDSPRTAVLLQIDFMSDGSVQPYAD